MERNEASKLLSTYSTIPDFALPNVNGETIDSSYLKAGEAALVIFTCNHCPYVIGSEDLIIETVKPFLKKGLRVVAICSNDATSYPDDSFDKMKEKSEALGLPYPYLHDESQEVAKSFDAACTPELYLFNKDSNLVWHGKPNNNPRDPSQATENHLEIALSQIFSGQTPEPAFVQPVGCSIKWK
ncbi:MAG: thioredoxin family protein [Bdellovibrionales bacterium]|nr:thioredoxin family protein [Bdellovibrionales bacterium]